MIKKTLLFPLLSMLWIGSLSAQDLVSVNDLFSTNQYLNKFVEVVGTIDRHAEIDTSSAIQGFVLRDQFGSEVMVRTTESHPTVNRTYSITGTFEEGPRQGNRPVYFIREQARTLSEGSNLHVVRINTLPEGSEVAQDGNIVGSTPYSVRLPDGNYTFKIEKPFYESRTLGLVVNGESVSRDIEMNRSMLFYLLSAGGVLLILIGGGYAYSTLNSRKNNSEASEAAFTSTVKKEEKNTAVDNPTIKIENPVKKTVKIVPGKFTVLSGITGLSELRLYQDQTKQRGEYTFGRDPGEGHYHFQLKSGTVSRSQAKLIVTNNDYALINYSSTNPTIVNGSPLRVNDSYTLNSGDIVEMGEVKLKFVK